MPVAERGRSLIACGSHTDQVPALPPKSIHKWHADTGNDRLLRIEIYWTETHPEIAFEDDINELLATHEALADCILNDVEARDSISQSLLDELPALRLKADKAVGLLAAIVDSSEDAIVSDRE
jgi:hypothetical protein